VQKRGKNFGRYFYACSAGGQNHGETCEFFKWLDVEKHENEFKQAQLDSAALF
jgi:hypothetical protein